MRAEEVQEEVRRQPFRPFRIVMTDGETFDIRHPDLLMVGKRSALVGLTAKPDDDLYERHSILDLVHIIRIEPLEAKSGSAKNGRKKH